MKAEQDPRDLRIAALESRLAEAEETLRAIYRGEVDALLVAGPVGDQVFTLQSADTPYRFLVEEINEGALLSQYDGTVLYANRHFAQLVGVPLEQVSGGSWLRFFSPADQPRVSALLEQAKSCARKGDFTLQGSDASMRAVQISLAPLKREALEGLAIVVTDLTARKAAEEAVRATNARLSELVTELEHFSYSISHDMRAPLRAMKSFAVLLQEDCQGCTRTENRELLDRISTAASRLDNLISGSLTYAKVLREDVPLEPVDLETLIHGLLQSYPNLLPEEADIELADPLPTVLGNEPALTQCFSNLLGNAVKFVRPGTRPRVRIRAERCGKSARIWVEDDGIGIPKSDQARIFDLFFRASESYEGTGMGLAIVRKVVARLGGRVGVESEEGAGSRFWVELSLAPSGRAQGFLPM